VAQKEYFRAFSTEILALFTQLNAALMSASTACLW